MIVLDTDHFTILSAPPSDRRSALEGRLRAAAAPDIAPTIITFEEQVRGWMAQIHRLRDPVRMVRPYSRLLALANTFRSWVIVPFDERAAQEFARLRSAHRRLGAQDLKIAAITLTRSALLLSANLQHFRQIPGLRVENWLEPPAPAEEE